MPSVICSTDFGNRSRSHPDRSSPALASIEQMETLDLNARAREIEDVVVTRLRALAADVGIIGEVRGRGAMLAIELVQPGSRDPNPDATKAIAAAALQAGVIVLTCGTYGNVIRLLPPLVISDDLLNEALSVLEDSIRTTAEGH